ncbi:hypothetical protein Q4561_08355 [Alteromonas sp. 1_MG-2023]|uniref:hypothetical protein n=1 Tax=Alteromonas sp. 1_MG-2023 TaxID=3062669 RepID=UPI0026E465CC|nr:hypothetical protein [Alteromonas sp. 1_MG-2023]MDO6567069.1 hypothetical protein [Alteromonas sp. 1_MG-2023]
MKNKNYVIRRDNNIVIIHVKGAWDAIITESFSNDFKNIGRMLSHAPWAHLVYFDEWALSTPDAEPVVNAMLVWAEAHNMTHTARVYKDNALKTYQLDRMIDLEEQKGLTRHFESASEGFSWLAEHGFIAESAKVLG